MTDRQLHYLVALADEKNMTATAQRLFISQPSLSYLLAHVEKELGTAIFNRETNPISLTYAGEKYIAAARKILDIQRGMINEVEDIKKGNRGSLRIGCGTQVSAFLLPKILPCFIREHPNVDLKLVEEGHALLCEKLTSGELDIIIANRPVQGAQTDCILLSEEELVLMAPISFQSEYYEEAGKAFPVIEAKGLEGIPFVLPKKSSNIRIMIDQLFSGLKITPNVIFETANINTCVSMVESEIGFTIYPHSSITAGNLTVKQYSFQGEHRRNLSAYFRKNSYKSQFMSDFIQTCSDLFEYGSLK